MIILVYTIFKIIHRLDAILFDLAIIIKEKHHTEIRL